MSGAFVHEAGLYGSDEELVSLLVPFAQEGAAAGEPTVFALHERNAEVVRTALADTPGVTFAPFAYTRPARAVRALLNLFEAHAAGDGGRLRIVGEVHDPDPATWEPWARYEAAVNRLYAGFAVQALCAYNTTTTPEGVLADVARTHHRITSADGGHWPSDSYESPEAFLTARPEPPADPLERTPPTLELVDPTPAAARRAIAGIASRHTFLRSERLDEFTYGLSEAVTNAHLHGRPPVRLRLWVSGDRLHAAVTDAGAGPTDPFAGLRPGSPRDGGGGGLGLWVTHQLCSQVTHAYHRGGFTIRLTAWDG